MVKCNICGKNVENPTHPAHINSKFHKDAEKNAAKNTLEKLELEMSGDSPEDIHKQLEQVEKDIYNPQYIKDNIDDINAAKMKEIEERGKLSEPVGVSIPLEQKELLDTGTKEEDFEQPDENDDALKSLEDFEDQFDEIDAVESLIEYIEDAIQVKKDGLIDKMNPAYPVIYTEIIKTLISWGYSSMSEKDRKRIKEKLKEFEK